MRPVNRYKIACLKSSREREGEGEEGGGRGSVKRSNLVSRRIFMKIKKQRGGEADLYKFRTEPDRKKRGEKKEKRKKI